MPVIASIYSIFQPLTDVFESILKFIHNTGGLGWGLSIVVLTVVVRAVLLPLTFRQVKSMVRMQALAPQMKALQAKYKQDKQRQQQEMMKFYKENNVNPFGSCLPLVLQLPVFFAVYAMLRQSLRLDICPGIQRMHNHGVLSSAHTIACGAGHHAGFLFINDLTSKASGLELVLLIVLYVGTQLGSSLVMSAATMDKNQRRIMLFMPVVFVIFIIRFPAGLLVYWITTNAWTIAQQYAVKRRVGPLRAATAGAGGAVVETTTSSGGSSGGAKSSTPSPKAPSSGSAVAKRSASGRDRAGANRAQAKAAGKSASAKGATAKSDGGSGSAGSPKAPPANGADRKGRERREPVTNGAPSGESAPNGIGALIRNKVRPAEEPEKSKLASAVRNGPPPKPPRKRKKRSGRRR